ncbi:MAG: hypothetical protein ACYC0V_10380 [Armatimonadota bacterium]
MRSKSWIWIVSVIVLLVIGSVYFTRSPSPRYTLVEIKGLGGAPFEAYAINNRDQIVGVSIMSRDENNGIAVLWNEGKCQSLGIPDPQGYCTLDLNDRGQVIGHYSPPKGLGRRSFLYENGKSIGLDKWRLLALDINEAGDVIGDILGDKDPDETVIWKNGKLRHIGPTDGHTSIINDKGQVATEYDSGGYPAFMWDNGKVKTLGELDVKCDSYDTQSINNKGQVVGTAAPQQHWTQPNALLEFINGLLHRIPEPHSPASYAFISENGKMRELDAGNVTDVAINNRGEIVGTCRVGKHGTQPFIMLGDESLDLNELIDRESGYAIKSVSDINDRGEIIGQATHNGEECAVLLKPISR